MAPASRQGLIIAAAALTVAAAGAMYAVVLKRAAPPTPIIEPTHTESAGSATKALDPLVQARSVPPPAKMKLDASIATSGGRVNVTFDQPVYSPTNARSWIAIARVGTPDSSYETWSFLDDGSRAATLAAPTQPGDYEVRMHDDYPQQTYHVVRRLPFAVESGLAEDPNPSPQPSKAAEHFTLSSATFRTNAEILVTFPEPLVAKKGEQYWITVARVGDADSSYGAWAYLPASANKTSLQAPTSTGKYEVRLHGNYPTESTNVVYRVPFEVD